MNWSERDQAIVWHPYTQMKTAGPPLAIVRAEGCTLFTDDGRTLLDGISSWWVNLHGHSHPHITRRSCDQVAKLEHVPFAGLTHPPAVELASELKPYRRTRRVCFILTMDRRGRGCFKNGAAVWRNRE
jgi:adenosylmethionine-8-amino-7-oxononanoate aminotransferase